MARLMSVAYTEDAVVARRKTVTRRLGWVFLRPGDRLTLVRKSMGRKPGEPLVRLAEVKVVGVRFERLCDIAPADVEREGFPDWSTGEFVEHFIRLAHLRYRDGRAPDETIVTRIEWVYLDG